MSARLPTAGGCCDAAGGANGGADHPNPQPAADADADAEQQQPPQPQPQPQPAGPVHLLCLTAEGERLAKPFGATWAEHAVLEFIALAR